MMRRRCPGPGVLSSWAIAGTLLVGCAAEAQHVGHHGFRGSGPSYLQAEPASAAAGPAVRDGAAGLSSSELDHAAGTWPGLAPVHAADADVASAGASARREEKALREQLAAAADPAAPALELAAFLCSGERYEAALAVVDAARERSVDPRVRVARAGLLRDLGRRGEARSELRALLRERGATELHPSLLLELAELEWIEGDRVAAKAVMVALRSTYADHVWCLEHRQFLGTMAAYLDRPDSRPASMVRDLLGDLRGAPQAAMRQRAFESLVLITRSHTDEETLARAVAVAAGDEAPALRARAVDLAQPDPESRAQFVGEALADTAPEVRLAAVARAVELLGQAALAVLLERLAVEDDPAVFTRLHTGLATLVTAPIDLPAEAADTAAGRLELVRAWRQRCNL